MPERSSVNQGVQIGDEVTLGTGVSADTRLSALSIMATPDMDFTQFRPAGNKFNTVSVLNKEFTSADLEGALTYSEIIYPFSSLFGAAAITTPATGTTSRQHEYIVNATAADDPVSFTVQRGDGVLREKFTGFVVNDLSLAFSRNGIDMSGNGFGKAMLADAGVMDTVTVTTPLTVVVPTQVSVYSDPMPGSPTLANIDTAFGTTKLTRVSSANFSFGNRYSQVWALDAAQAGHVAVVEVPVAFSAELVMQADAAGMARLATARAGTPQLIRVEAVGAIIETTITYKLTLDFIGRITEGGDFSDEDGVQTITWGMQMMYDNIWTKAMRARVVNIQAAL